MSTWSCGLIYRNPLSSKRMQLAGVSGVRNVRQCSFEKSPQLMHEPLGGLATPRRYLDL